MTSAGADSGPDPVDPSATDRLAAAILEGDRRALARAITLVESTRDDDQRRAEALLERVLPHSGRAVRVGISGSPGVGKSTFIEAFGIHLLDCGHRVAVLAVDPTSSRTGGSILGDRTRMIELSRRDGAFIRPSPAGQTLGGVARRTREAMLLVEAAGFDVVLVETVGVGQSETAVAAMVDMFLLLVSPGAGDELQGIKRGIMELADLVVVTKADGDLAGPANHAAADYRRALHLLRRRFECWSPDVALVSSVTGRGVPEVWEQVTAHRRALTDAGDLDLLRAGQRREWLWTELSDGVLARFRRHPGVAARLARIEAAVADGTTSPVAGARTLLDSWQATGLDSWQATGLDSWQGTGRG